MNPMNQIEEAAATLAQSAYLVGVFYQALKDQRLPDALVEGIVRDWHYAMMEVEEWSEEEAED